MMTKTRYRGNPISPECPCLFLIFDQQAWKLAPASSVTGAQTFYSSYASGTYNYGVNLTPPSPFGDTHGHICIIYISISIYVFTLYIYNVGLLCPCVSLNWKRIPVNASIPHTKRVSCSSVEGNCYTESSAFADSSASSTERNGKPCRHCFWVIPG